MSGYGYASYDYGYGHGSSYGYGGYYSIEPGAYDYHHGLSYAGESYYYATYDGAFRTVNSGYETDSGGKVYYAATFSPTGIFAEASYQTVTADGAYHYQTTYVSNYEADYGSAYQYNYHPLQNMTSTQRSYYEHSGESGYFQTVNNSSSNYFDGLYRGFYSTRSDMTYAGHTVPEQSNYYILRSYQDSYGYTSYTSSHS